MQSRVLTVCLAIALALSLGVLLSASAGNVRLPGNQTGYEPVQPIAYSHRLHAGELGLDCLSCHVGAETSRTAGIPSASVCMNCHRFVTAPFNVVREEDEAATREKRSPRRIVSPELAKLYSALALGEELKPDPGRAREPIAWVKVHNLPDYVYFDHRAHVSASVDCQSCHGQIQTMERVRQVEDLSMGWCVSCHRESNRKGVKGKPVKAPIDCSGCHY